MWEQFFRELSQASLEDLSPDLGVNQQNQSGPKKILQPAKTAARTADHDEKYHKDGNWQDSYPHRRADTPSPTYDDEPQKKSCPFPPLKGPKVGVEHAREGKKSRKKQNERGMKMIEGKWRFPEEMKHHLQFWNPVGRGAWIGHPMVWCHQFVPFFKNKARPGDSKRGAWALSSRFPKKGFPRFSPRLLADAATPRASLGTKAGSRVRCTDRLHDDTSTLPSLPPISKQTNPPDESPGAHGIERLMQAQSPPMRSFKNQRYENLMKKFLPPRDDSDDNGDSEISGRSGRKVAQVRGPLGEIMDIEVSDEDDDLIWIRNSRRLPWYGRAERGMIYRNGHWKYQIK